MLERLEGTVSAAKAIARVHYTHDAMIEAIMDNPIMSQGDLARMFGYTEPWISRVINSDAFQARLALRKNELLDPSHLASIEERFRNLAMTSLDIVQEKLHATRNVELAFKGLEAASKALNYGARHAVQVQNNFVVALPSKAVSDAAWAATHNQTMTVTVDG